MDWAARLQCVVVVLSVDFEWLFFAQGAQEEQRSRGGVPMSVYTNYFRSMGGLWVAFVILALFALRQSWQTSSDWFLAWWSSDALTMSQSTCMGIFFGLSMGTILTSLTRNLTLAYGTLKGSYTMHQQMIDAVLRSPPSFFGSFVCFLFLC